MESERFLIGGYVVEIEGSELIDGVAALGSFANFRYNGGADRKALLSFSYSTEDCGEMCGDFLYSSENDGVVSEFYSMPEKGCFFQKMRHENGEWLNMKISGESGVAVIYGSLMPQMLRFAMWIGFGVMLSGNNAIAIHSSCIVYEGKAVLFLGESGTGKSTHTRLWRESIPGASLLNDDSPILRAEEDGIYVYGSPWSGKTPCYKQQRCPLAAIVRLYQAPFNKIEKLPLLYAYGSVHPSCPPDFAYDTRLYDGISSTIGKVLESVPVYKMGCLPDHAAAQLSCETIFKG